MTRDTVRVEDICAYAQDDTLYELGATFHCPAAGCLPWFVPMPDPTIGALTAAAAEHVRAHHPRIEAGTVCRHCHHRLRLCRCGIGGDEGHWVTAPGTPLPDVTQCGPYPGGERWRRHEPEP